MSAEQVKVEMTVPKEYLMPRLAETLRSHSNVRFEFFTGGLIFWAEKALADQVRADLRLIGARGGTLEPVVA